MNLKSAGLSLCSIALGIAALPISTLAAPPTLEHLFPPGGKRGATVEVTAAGSFGTWPVQAWVNRPGLAVVAASDKGKFTVTIAEDAEPGVYWLRAIHPEGASSLRPFVVGSLDEVAEIEPNETLNKCQAIADNMVVNGRLGKGGDVDAFQLDLQAGQTLVAALAASQTLGSPMDAVIQVCDERGFVIEQNDDAHGTDPMVVLSVPRDGPYFVRLFAFPATPNSTIGFAGGKDFVYRLTLTTAGFVDHALPLAVSQDRAQEVRLFGWNLDATLPPLTVAATTGSGSTRLFSATVSNSLDVPVVESDCVVATADSSPEHPQSISLPVVISGQIEADRDVDAFRFTAAKGDKLFFRVESDALGYLLDPMLKLVDNSGKIVGEVDDTSRERDCELTVTIPADGDYDLQIRDVHFHGGFRYVYRLTATKADPSFELSLTQDAFVLTPGKPLEIEVAINRLRGFNEAIEVTAFELPAGVEVKSATSAAKGDSAKKVKLVLTASAGPMAGTFRIRGKAAEGGLERLAHFSPPGTAESLDLPYLTVIGTAKP